MEILSQLGANQTAFIQFIIFLVSISFLTIFVYGPYFRAYDQRLHQTKGSDQVAQETQDEAKKIEAIFQVRAREINQKIQNTFELSKNKAGESVNLILNEAKTSATKSIDIARKDIEAQKTNAEKDILNISQEVAVEISKKLTGAV